MQINLKKDAFLGQLFPGLKDEDWQDDSRLAQYLRNAYSRGGYTPVVKIEDEIVQIYVDEHKVAKVNKVYQEALKLAAKGSYDRAKALVKPLIDEGTQNAELFRVYGQCLAEEGDKEGAMNSLIDALKWDPNHTDSLIMMGNLYSEGDGELENATGRLIEIEPSGNIPNAAKLEVAEYKNRENHRVLYKPEYTAIAHLIMHELIHLELITEARTIGENQLFVSGDKEAQLFRSRTGAAQKRLAKAGFDENRIEGFLDMLFNGINSQIFNAPIDLFIEQRLYDRYPALRPIQFLSLLRLNQEAIEGANTEAAKAYSPRFVRDANITLSFTQLFLFRELFGLDMTGEIKEPRLHKKAKKLYADFLKMRDDKEPGEEYDLVQWWGEDLELKGMYRLVGEKI